METESSSVPRTLPRAPATARRSASVPLTRLQLSPQIIAALEAESVTALDHLIDFAERGALRRFRYRSELTSALSAFAAATSGDETDWPAYWEQRGYVFHHLAADVPELRSLDADSARQPIDRKTFGNAGAMLHRAGYTTLGALADGLRDGIEDVRGMGPAKMRQFFDRLLEVVDMLRHSGSVVPADSLEPSASAFTVNPSGLPLDVRRLSAGVLHLGAKSKWLREAGLLTIGQIADVWPIEHGDIQGLGPTTLGLLSERFHALVSSTSPLGTVDLERYCLECGIALVPASSSPVTGSEFVESLSSTLVEIADSLPDRVYAEILRSRLSRMPGEQKTLEEIARSVEPPITRERVRQKEKQLLRQLPGGLIWDTYSGLDIHFRPGFAKWWRIAASRFRDAEEIEFDEFVTGLAQAWDVDVPSLTSQLPIILAIVTGEPGIPVGFRSAFGLDPVYYCELRDEVVHLPVSRLRLNKDASRLDADGIRTLGDFVQLCRTGAIADRQTSSTRRVAEHLNLIAGCLDATGQISWPSYRMTLGLDQLPSSVTSSAEAFATGLPGTIAELLGRCQITGRAADIFRLRTSQSRGNRITLAETAERLGTFGPSIKREETFLLQRLNDMIVGREYALLPVWLEESWLRYWREAETVFVDTQHDFDSFRASLLKLWRLQSADRAIAILWSILSGYPNGRPNRRPEPVDRIKEAAPDPSPVGRVRLRGFRRVH